jgi:hypothetical protein
MKEGAERLYLQAGLFDIVSQVWQQRVAVAARAAPKADVELFSMLLGSSGEDASFLTKMFEYAEGLSTDELYALRIELGRAFLRELDQKLAGGMTF